MVSEDTELEAICKRIDQRKQFAEKKVKDLEKQAKDTCDSLQRDNKGDWDSITEWLRNKGRLPADYNEQTHNISFNVRTNGVKIERLDSDYPGEPGTLPSQFKNMGLLPIDSLPPELRNAMQSFVDKLVPPKD